MPIVPVKCTQCGAVLQAGKEKDSAVCPHCSTPFIIEKAVNNYIGITSQYDFEIRAGELINYNGAAVDVVIPDNVIVINEGAFKGCEMLRSIEIPASVTKIEPGAFSDCSNLSYIKFKEESAFAISDGAFLRCSSLKSIAVPDSVTSIGKYAFAECTGLTDINIPGNTAVIGDGAFFACSSLNDITVPDSVTSIGEHAFAGCSSLKYFAFPDGISVIEESTFAGCTGLINIIVPDNITSIGANAFAGCTGLKDLALPDGLSDIGENAFAGCSGLETINGAPKKQYGSFINTDGPDERLKKANAAGLSVLSVSGVVSMITMGLTVMSKDLQFMIYGGIIFLLGVTVSIMLRNILLNRKKRKTPN